MDGFKAEIFKEIEKLRDKLVKTSHSIHSNPELCYKETFAHDTLCDLLESEGIDVERNAYGIETAFAARAGTSGPQIAILCEYDALAEIGHACGHNIIATAGAGAGIAAAKAAEQLDGKVLILGTPAEEGGGGKIKLLEAGAFEGIDAAIMLHPAGHDLLKMNTLAVRQLGVVYEGAASHSAAAPHKGKNALDAAVIAYSAVSALRQHIRSEERVHGIFLKAGSQVNVVPDKTEMYWQIRSDTRENLERLIPRVMSCFEAGATAAGCKVETFLKNPDYFEMRDNDSLLALYASNSALVDRMPVEPDSHSRVAGSTDMGNVSQQIPSIHPMLKVAPGGVSLHTREFAECAVSEQADQGIIDGARILAGVAVDFWSSREARISIQNDFERQNQN